jgi:hypothetical protein
MESRTVTASSPGGLLHACIHNHLGSLFKPVGATVPLSCGLGYQILSASHSYQGIRCSGSTPLRYAAPLRDSDPLNCSVCFICMLGTSPRRYDNQVTSNKYHHRLKLGAICRWFCYFNGFGVGNRSRIAEFWHTKSLLGNERFGGEQNRKRESKMNKKASADVATCGCFSRQRLARGTFRIGQVEVWGLSAQAWPRPWDGIYSIQKSSLVCVLFVRAYLYIAQQSEPHKNPSAVVPL